jgi:hypothetical protein
MLMESRADWACAEALRAAMTPVASVEMSRLRVTCFASGGDGGNL